MSEPRRRKRASQWPFQEEAATETAAQQPPSPEQPTPAPRPADADDPALAGAVDAIVADANEMPTFRRDGRHPAINVDLLSDELFSPPPAKPEPELASEPAPQPEAPAEPSVTSTPVAPAPAVTPAAAAAVTPSAVTPAASAHVPAQPVWADATHTDPYPQGKPAPVTPQPAAPQPAAQPVAPQPVAPQPVAPQPVAPQPVAQPVTPQPAAQPVAPQPVTPQPAAQPVTPQPVTPAPAEAAQPAFEGNDLESLLNELADDDVTDVTADADADDLDLTHELDLGVDLDLDEDDIDLDVSVDADTDLSEPAAGTELAPIEDLAPAAPLTRLAEPELDAGGPVWSGIPIAGRQTGPSAPRPDSDEDTEGLAADEAFWAGLGDDDTDEDELVAPAFPGATPDTDESDEDGSGLRTLLRRRPEPRPIARDVIDRLKDQARQRVSDLDHSADEQSQPAFEPAPLGLDDDHDETAPPEEWHPPIYVAARQAVFAGPQTLSLISPNLKSDVDELNDALAAFGELQPGQKGFIRASIRSYPEFKGISTAWVQQRKHGVNPDAEKPGMGRSLISWLRYAAQRMWFEGNKSSRYLGGSLPPARPGQTGEAKPLPANARSEEEKAAEKDATAKARDSHHFETVLRIGVVTKNDDAQEAERIVEEVAAGFEVYATEHQQLAWGAADPYDTCIGYMTTKRPERVGLSLSAAELGELARVPDDLTRPHGVRIRHSSFKQIMPGNRILIDNPYDPPAGVIPLGVLSPRSEDAQVIGIRNAELDRHMFFCGRTGTGKSEMMKWLIFGVAKADYPLVVIDPHGALVDDLVNTLIVNCPERIDDLVVADLGDPDHPVALNPLDIHSKEQIEPTVGAVMEMLAKHMSLGQGAPRASNYAVQALAALTEANLYLSDPDTKTTLLHIVRFFQDEEFRRLIMAFCTNAAAQEMFDPENGPYEQMNEKARIDQVMPVIRAFQQLSRSESFSAVFSSGENRLDFARLIMGKKIVLIKLARFAHQKKLGEFIGALVIPYLLASMDEWGRRKDPITGQTIGRGCRIFVDEAPTLIGPESAAIQLLAEARKWDFGMVFASQYLSQFDPSVMKAALANTATKVTLALDPDNTTQVSKAIAGTSGLIGPNDIANLPDYHMYANVLLPTGDGGKATSGVFSAACLKPINCELNTDHVQLRQQVLERSWTLICSDRAEIIAKQKTLVEDIKSTLLTKLQERLEAGSDPLAGHNPGQRSVDYGIDLDGGDDFAGW